MLQVSTDITQAVEIPNNVTLLSDIIQLSSLYVKNRQALDYSRIEESGHWKNRQSTQ